jgi:hypothetical protein
VLYISDLPEAPLRANRDLPRSGTTLFASFLEKEEYYCIIKGYYECNWLLGARPQTPRVGFAEVWANHDLPRSGTTLFASFSGKRRLLRYSK